MILFRVSYVQPTTQYVADIRADINGPSCAILFLDREKNELYVKQIIGRDLEEVKNLGFKVGTEGIVGWVAKTGEPLYVSDISKDHRVLPMSAQGRSEAAFPLKMRERVIGVMDIECNEVNGFDQEDLKVLSSFASQVSISIEKKGLCFIVVIFEHGSFFG